MSTVTPSQRQALLDGLATGFDDLARTIQPLTHDQWHWIAAPGAWSIAMCCEHIDRTESFILERIATAGSEGLELAAGKDDFVTRAVTNRTRKVPAPENMVPTGSVHATPQDFLTAFEITRGRAQALASAGEIDLRAICAPHFALKELDGFQWLLMTSAHLRRHLGQINEVAAHPDFPR